ncbi:MAG: hypothetical protein RIR11_2723 [Bacteroidota bacterium]|jgi:hypothetical protein
MPCLRSKIVCYFRWLNENIVLIFLLQRYNDSFNLQNILWEKID